MTFGTIKTGLGWPDITEPGVPAAPLNDGFHWLAMPSTGEMTMGIWSAQLWCWSVTAWGTMLIPETLAHLEYVGRAQPPLVARL